MYSTVTSGTLYGIRSCLLQVECDIAGGLPAFHMVGLPSTEVREAAERVRVALRNLGVRMPPSRITVSFAPADVPKHGVILDLPVAVGILVSMGILRQQDAEGIMIAGELGLSGEIRPVRGILPLAAEAASRGLGWCIVPRANLAEARSVCGVRSIGVATLAEAVDFLRMSEEEREAAVKAAAVPAQEAPAADRPPAADLADIRGQDAAKRVLEIAAAGFHNLLFFGPPGVGKSMLASALPGILPALTREESMEVSAIYSIAGRIPENEALIRERPFVAPHHSVTRAALIGGGAIPMPGLISLAHRGVLFLDEITLFKPEILDLLRQPMEERAVRLSRAAGTFVYPSRFMLAAAANPCACGYLGEPGRCRCTPAQVQRHQARLSGPVMDRMDLCVRVREVPMRELMSRGSAAAEGSTAVRERVCRARDVQAARYAGEDFSFNGDMDSRAVERYCAADAEGERLLEELYDRMRLSVRGLHRLLRVARTIADLAGEENIGAPHIAEAAGYRMQDRLLMQPEGRMRA